MSEHDPHESSDRPDSTAPDAPEAGDGSGAAPPPPPPGAGSGAAGAGSGAAGAAPPPPGGVSENRSLYLVLSYLGPLALIPYLVEQGDPEVRWHSRHGLVLLAAEIAIVIVLSVLNMIPAIGCLFWLLSMLFGFAVLGFHLFLIYKAVNGERVLVPAVSEYAERLP